MLKTPTTVQLGDILFGVGFSDLAFPPAVLEPLFLCHFLPLYHLLIPSATRTLTQTRCILKVILKL